MSYLYPCKPNSLSPESRFFDELDHDIRWIAEVKKNGWRCLPVREGESLTLWNRHKRVIDEPLEELREGLTALPSGTVLDGELLHFRTRGIKGRLYLFDILEFRGELLVDRPLARRRGILELVVKDYLAGCPQIALAEQVRLGKKELYFRSVEDGEANEGIVLKKLDSIYPASRQRCLQNPFWLKVKRVENHFKN